MPQVRRVAPPALHARISSRSTRLYNSKPRGDTLLGVVETSEEDARRHLGEVPDQTSLSASNSGQRGRHVKTAITAAELLNDRVIPFFDQHEIPLCRVLTDRGTEFCGNPERHEYELYLAVEDIDHSRTKTKSPQTNGICERFHKTILQEYYRVAFRKKVYRIIAELQADLDGWMAE